MAKLSALRVDPELSEEGRWVDYELGIRLRIARHNNSPIPSLLYEAAQG